MKTSELFKEYIWLIDLLKTYGGITFEEINEKWVQTEMSGGVEMARSTFNRHKDAIEDIFGIYIECDRSNGYVYYIGNAKVLDDDTIQTWMLSTLAAEFGDDLAKSNLADIYRKGTNGVIKDMKKAFELYQSCHIPYAYYRVGEALEFGRGVEKDVEKAKQYYRVAYREGHPLARRKLQTLNFLD